MLVNARDTWSLFSKGGDCHGICTSCREFAPRTANAVKCFYLPAGIAISVYVCCRQSAGKGNLGVAKYFRYGRQ